MTDAWWIEHAAALTVGIVVMVIELRTKEIPNWITLPMFFAGLAVGLWDRRFADHFGGALAAALITFAAYRQDALGGGAVKWICAAAALTGLRTAFTAMCVAAVLLATASVVARLAKPRVTWVASSPFVIGTILAAIGIQWLQRR